MKYFERIQRRLDGKMTEEEAAAFDRERKENKALAEEYELQQLEDDLLDFALEEEIRAEVQTARRAYEQQNTKGPAVSDKPASKSGKTRSLNWKAGLSIAAGLALLAVAYFLLLPRSDDPSPIKVAQAVYQENPPNLSGGKRTADPQQDDDKRMYKQLTAGQPEQVREAVAYFDAQASTDPAAYYYLGHGYWQLGKYEQAARSFERLLEAAETDRGSELYLNTQFYYALSLLAQGQTEQAGQFVASLDTDNVFKPILEKTLKKVRY